MAIDHAAYALVLTVGAMLVLFLGAVSCASISILLINLEKDDE